MEHLFIIDSFIHSITKLYSDLSIKKDILAHLSLRLHCCFRASEFHECIALALSQYIITFPVVLFRIKLTDFRAPYFFKFLRSNF